jgi:fermentation-respiration switch protein FrsA (DUF1100 family)
LTQLTVVIDALPFGIMTMIYLAAGLLLAFVAFEIYLGWSFFRYASKRAEAQDFTPPANLPPQQLDWYKTVAVAKERLLLQAHEEWEMERDGLILKGLFFPSRPGVARPWGRRACAVVVHGWRDVRLSRAPDVQMYLDQGFSVFLPSLRGHAPSGGRRIDIGCQRRKDLFAWMEIIRERSDNPDFFVLDGLSMGAANALMASGDQELPRKLVAVIADCGYSSLVAQGKWMVRGMKPVIRYPALCFATTFFYLFMGYSRKDPTPLTQVARAKVPVMIIHGKEDLFVPASMAEELYQACGSPLKELWYVEGAKHALSFSVAGDLYRNRKMAFIDRALGASYKEG